MNTMCPNLAARQVLMSAYLYYKRDESVLSDGENDALVVSVVNNWDKIEDRYKPLLLNDETDCKVLLTSTFHCQYTKLVEGGALHWLEVKTGVKLARLDCGYYETKEGLTANLQTRSCFMDWY